MWQRKKLKRQAKQTLKRNYFYAVAVCFIVAMFTGIYTTSVGVVHQYDKNNETEQQVENLPAKDTASDLIHEELAALAAKGALTGRQLWLVNTVDNTVDAVLGSNTAIVSVLKVINAFALRHTELIGALLAVGLTLKLLYDVYIVTALEVGRNRFFLETRRYCGTRISRMFYLFRLRGVKHNAWVMLFKNVQLFLWTCTIVGGPIKHYEYYMIPHLLAENPAITRKDAFALSKEMMRGSKWRAFVLDVSFFWWDLLSVCTLGILDIFFLNPYKCGVAAELYMELRARTITAGSTRANLFVDSYLVQPPEGEAAAQQAVHAGQKSAHPQSATEQEKESVYREVEDYVLEKVRELREKPQYPAKDYPVSFPKAHPLVNLHPERHYTFTSLLLLFFTFSVFGWLWEVALHLVNDGTFVNRGVMFGPWLPIYGSGGVLVVLLLRRWIHKPVLTFCLVTVLCCTVEYFTSWYLEVTRHTKWWDYSGFFMNLNGRICLEGALVFGFGGCAFLYVIAPLMDDLYHKIPRTVKVSVCTVLCVLFCIDFAYSSVHPNTGKGITDYDTASSTQSESANARAASPDT